jgi:hypothetical protein
MTTPGAGARHFRPQMGNSVRATACEHRWARVAFWYRLWREEDGADRHFAAARKKATSAIRQHGKEAWRPARDSRSRQLLSGATHSAANLIDICKRRPDMGLAVAVLGPRRAGVGAVVGQWEGDVATDPSYPTLRSRLGSCMFGCLPRMACSGSAAIVHRASALVVWPCRRCLVSGLCERRRWLVPPQTSADSVTISLCPSPRPLVRAPGAHAGADVHHVRRHLLCPQELRGGEAHAHAGLVRVLHQRGYQRRGNGFLVRVSLAAQWRGGETSWSLQTGRHTEFSELM